MTVDDAVALLDASERERLCRLALGRIFAMGQRATLPGDVATFDRCRAIILAIDALERPARVGPNPHAKGAPGD